LPPLNDHLNYLSCSNNQLNYLPYLPIDLNFFASFWNNPICKIVGNDSNKINKLAHFREFYFLSKFKRRFISWMWKSRKERIEKEFHPNILISAINSFNDSEDSTELDNWLKKNWN
jgi:hypothetical protein